MNFVKNYDGVFVCCILVYIEFELLDKECCMKLWEYLLLKEILIIEDINLELLVNEFENFVGGDILNVVIFVVSWVVIREVKV